MNSIIITPKDDREYSEIVKYLKKMKVKMELTSTEEGKFRRMTMDEYRDMIDQSVIDANEGRTISHEDLGKEIEGWR
ncbi:hypothetical protein LJB80_00710 [Bacteroides sp. OttesenSCG-928-F21]|nr:hypothetical protein [Bacteroides sp. OttesenSCG-928-F21]